MCYIYRFPHITYPYSSCICSFLQQHPYFCYFCVYGASHSSLLIESTDSMIRYFIYFSRNVTSVQSTAHVYTPPSIISSLSSSMCVIGNNLCTCMSTSLVLLFCGLDEPANVYPGHVTAIYFVLLYGNIPPLI